MKRTLAATCLFILTSNPTYGEEREKSQKDMKQTQEQTQKTTKTEMDESEERNPASANGEEVSLIEKHYIMYE